MITQVFPDEFHLNTLDQLLPAITRLNRHVNIKAIVIGLMNRLSAYAEREAESESPEDKMKSEEEATTNLLKMLKISKEKEAKEKEKAKQAVKANGEQMNGSTTEHESAVEGALSHDKAPAEVPAVAEVEEEEVVDMGNRSRGIPSSVKLYEIFFGQVTHLVREQRLPIQDTIALLVSLANLAL